MAGRRAPVASVIAAAVVLLVAELGTRAIESNLPEPLQFHSAEAQLKVAQMDALAARDGADIVFLGTSMVNAAAEPAVVEGAVDGVIAYNAALSSGIPRLMELWARAVVLPRLRPSLVVIGIASFDLGDSGGEGRTAFLEGFEDSPGGRNVLRRESALERADRWLGTQSALWQHRRELRRPTVVLRALRGRAPEVPPDVAAIQENGRTAFRQDQRFEDRVRGVGLPLDGWSIGRADLDALGRLVDAVDATGARSVLVLLPVTDEYVARHPNGTADYDLFVRTAQQFSRDTGTDLVDLSYLRDHAGFADEVHMNVDGARRFSTELVTRLQELGAIPVGGG